MVAQVDREDREDRGDRAARRVRDEDMSDKSYDNRQRPTVEEIVASLSAG